MIISRRLVGFMTDLVTLWVSKEVRQKINVLRAQWGCGQSECVNRLLNLYYIDKMRRKLETVVIE